jgi:hypothetical protein
MFVEVNADNGATKADWTTGATLTLSNGNYLASGIVSKLVLNTANGGYNSGAIIHVEGAGGYTQGQLVFSTGWDTSGNGTERMRINASGNVGIGTNAPVNKLDVVGITQVYDSRGTSGYDSLKLIGGSPSFFPTIEAVSGTSPLVFRTNSAERMRLTADGNLLVGTTTNTGSRKVSVVGSIASTFSDANDIQGVLLTDANGVYLAATYGSTGSYKPIIFNTSGNEKARIDTSGNLLVGITSTLDFARMTVKSDGTVISVQTTANGNYGLAAVNAAGSVVGGVVIQASATQYNTSSDQRLKENIVDADSASSLIDSLQVRQFDWKSDNLHQRYGFIAQELVTVVPEAVHQPADTEEMMGVDYSKLVPMLVKEIQSLRARVLQLETN